MSEILLDTNIALRLLDRNAQEHPVCVQAIKNLLCRGSKQGSACGAEWNTGEDCISQKAPTC
jgi:hypothetical protein